jgi:hypothetical protein
MARAEPHMVKVDRPRYRVIKTLAPSDRGAIELAREYGEALVCVRYRTDGRGKVRHTTVELLVASKPIRPRSTRQVHLRLEPFEHDLRRVVKAAGGEWDPARRLWRLPRRVANILNLRERMIAT